MTTTLTDDDFTVPTQDEHGDTVTWKPAKVGDTIVGTISRWGIVDTPFAKEKTVIDFVNVETITADGAPVEVPAGDEVSFWPTPGAIRALKEVGITDAGHKVALRIMELIDTQKGNPYRKFGAVDLGAGDVFAADKPADDDSSPF